MGLKTSTLTKGVAMGCLGALLFVMIVLKIATPHISITWGEGQSSRALTRRSVNARETMGLATLDNGAVAVAKHAFNSVLPPKSNIGSSGPRGGGGGVGSGGRDKWAKMDEATLIDTIARVLAQPPPVPADPQCRPPELAEPTCTQSFHCCACQRLWWLTLTYPATHVARVCSRAFH
jgi:hypothetical protein